MPDKKVNADVCSVCGLANDEFYLVDSTIMCEACRIDYRIDHPDMEELICKAEYQHDPFN